MTDEGGYCQRELAGRRGVSPRSLSVCDKAKPWRAALAWTDGGVCPYAIIGCPCMIIGCSYALLGAECRASSAAFTLADTSSVSRTVNPVVGIISPTRISSGWHLMW